MTLLLLWDIDGTLLSGATDDHRDALHAGLRQVYGIDPVGVPVEPAGRTDLEIARQILVGRGVEARRIEAGFPDLRRACTEAYARMEPTSLGEFVLPGVPEALESLAAREDMVVALLTGNFEAIARMKLRRAGIERFFAHGQGAFGSDSEDRTDLPLAARRRAGSPGHPWPQADTVVIGDTPRDVACARADGVRCLAVTTGRFAADELSEADAVVATAREASDVLVGWAAG